MESPHDIQVLLEQYLTQRDEPCPLCGYNLRDLKGQRCPECGDALRLHVGLVEPRRAAFLAGLIGLAAGGGFSAVILMYALWYNLFKRGMGPSFDDVVMMMAEVAWSSALIMAWLWKSGRIRQFSPMARWTLATACWLLPVINFIVFVNTIR